MVLVKYAANIFWVDVVRDRYLPSDGNYHITNHHKPRDNTQKLLIMTNTQFLKIFVECSHIILYELLPYISDQELWYGKRRGHFVRKYVQKYFSVLWYF
jgi:hypothetical protein